MEDSNKKGKEKHGQKEDKESMIISNDPITIPPSSTSSSSAQQKKPSLDLNLPPPSTQPDHHAPPTTPTPSSSAPSTTEPEPIQEAKRVKLNALQHQPNTQDSPSPNDQPPSGRPPHHPQHSQLTADPPPAQLPTVPETSSGPTEEAQQAQYLNPAQLRIHLPEERSRGLFSLTWQRAIKRKEYKVFPPMVTRNRPGPSPLGPGHPSPYDMVKDVLSEMKQFLNNYSAFRASKKPHQSPKPPLFPTPQRNAMSSSSVAPVVQAAGATSGPLTLEEVIVMLDEYLEAIPRTVSAQEMEDKLQEFQTRVGIVDVDPDESSWYGLMKNSTFEFWEKMTDHFVCETIESDEDDANGDGDDDDD